MKCGEGPDTCGNGSVRLSEGTAVQPARDWDTLLLYFAAYKFRKISFKMQVTGAVNMFQVASFCIWVSGLLYSFECVCHAEFCMAVSLIPLFLLLLQWEKMPSGLKSHSIPTPIQSAKGNSTSRGPGTRSL